MKLEFIKETDKNCFMNVFGERTNVAFEYGKGINLYDTDDKEYMDLLGGIAVNVLGHNHSALTKAICDQAHKVIHTSSLYYIEPQAKLAKLLCGISCADKVFFANSGAEANEGAIKLARAYFYQKGEEQKNEIITLEKSFHGRTMATLSATGQEKYQKKFKPISEGFKYVEMNNIEALKNNIGENTCAIMLELVQGESGINLLDKNYVKEVKELCTKKDLLLIFDEVQTGMGRTGKMFAYENYGIEPDIFTLAKALAGGVPIGALLANKKVSGAFEPGDHGSTFGGNFLATRAANAVIDTIIKDNLLENCTDVGNYTIEELEKIKDKNPSQISDVRGLGLMIGIEFKDDIAVEIKNKLFDEGFLVGSVGKNIIRILPPLIINKKDIKKFINALSEVLN